MAPPWGNRDNIPNIPNFRSFLHFRSLSHFLFFYGIPEPPEPSKNLPGARTSIFPKSRHIPSHGDPIHPKYDHFGHVRLLPRTIYFQNTDPYDPPYYLVNYSPSNFGDPSQVIRKALLYRKFATYFFFYCTVDELSRFPSGNPSKHLISGMGTFWVYCQNNIFSGQCIFRTKTLYIQGGRAGAGGRARVSKKETQGCFGTLFPILEERRQGTLKKCSRLSHRVRTVIVRSVHHWHLDVRIGVWS